jgi:hypothetical protein
MFTLVFLSLNEDVLQKNSIKKCSLSSLSLMVTESLSRSQFL